MTLLHFISNSSFRTIFEMSQTVDQVNIRRKRNEQVMLMVVPRTPSHSILRLRLRQSLGLHNLLMHASQVSSLLLPRLRGSRARERPCGRMSADRLL